MSVTVVLADDDATVRSALRLVLESDPRFEVLGEAEDGHALPEVVRRLRPDVVLMDVQMPGGGPDLCRELVADAHPPVVVAVSAHHQTPVVRSLLRAGATAYLGKGLLGDGLGDLVARCAQGHVVIAVPQAREVLRGWSDA